MLVLGILVTVLDYLKITLLIVLVKVLNTNKQSSMLSWVCIIEKLLKWILKIKYNFPIGKYLFEDRFEVK